MNVDLTITGRVESLHLEPGDRIIVTLDQNPPAPRMNDLQKALKEIFPDNEAVILAKGLRIVREAAE